MPWSVRPCSGLTIYRPRKFRSTLTGLPAEPANRCSDADCAPEGDDADRPELRPDVVMADHHVAGQLGEVGEGEDVGDRLQEAGVVLRREERARDDRHREVE